MRALIYEKQLVVALTDDETLRLAAGLTVGDRINPMMPDAKITVAPFGDDIQAASFTQGEAGFLVPGAPASRARMDTDHDLRIEVPRAIAGAAFVVADSPIIRDDVVICGEYAEALRAQLPSEGVVVRFDDGRCASEGLKQAIAAYS